MVVRNTSLTFLVYLTCDNINSGGLFSPSEYYFIALAVHLKLSMALIGSIILHTGAARTGPNKSLQVFTKQYCNKKQE